MPDLLVCAGGRFIGVELKGPRGKPSPLQLYNIERIQRAGGIAMVLYPDQFEDFKRLIEEVTRE